MQGNKLMLLVGLCWILTLLADEWEWFGYDVLTDWLMSGNGLVMMY